MSTKRAAIYCRVSRDEQADNYSLPTQEAECRAYAERMGYEVFGVWREDFTGTAIDRPEMGKILRLVHSRQIDVVLSYKVDRLTRGGNFALGWFLTEFTRHGAVGEFVVEPLDDSPEGQVMAGFRAGSASREVKDIRERTNRGLRAKVKAGKPIGRIRPPFGLRYKPAQFDAEGLPIKGTVHTAYEANPDTIDTLRWMFTGADEGASLRSISKGLEQMCVLPPQADRTGSTHWTPSSVKHILTNRAYIGEGIQFAKKVEKHPDPSKKTLKTRREINPDGDGAIPLPPGVFPVVIDSAQFERVQRRLSQNKHESQRADRNPDFGLLRRGMARCGCCNGSLSFAYRTGRDDSGKAARYFCQSLQRQRHGHPACEMSVTKLDEFAWGWIKRLRDDPRLVERFADRAKLNQGTEDSTTIALRRLEADIEDVDTKRGKLTKRLALVDDDTATLVAEELRQLADSRRALVMKRDHLAVKAEAEDRRRQRIERAVDIVSGIAETNSDLDSLTYSEKRRILMDLGVVAHVYPEGGKPRWGMTLSFDSQSSRIRAVCDDNLSVVWDEDADFDEAQFYLSSPLWCASRRRPGCGGQGRPRRWSDCRG